MGVFGNKIKQIDYGTMGTARRITRNFLSLAVSEVISKIIQLIIFVYIARLYSTSDFGKLGFAFAFAQIMLVVIDFGLYNLLIREISRNKNEVGKYISNAILIKISLAVLTFLATFFYLNLFVYASDIKMITYFMVLFTILGSFTELFYAVCRAFEIMYYDSMIKVLRMVVLSILVFIFVINNASLIVVSSMFPLTEIIMLVVSYLIYTKKFAKFSIKADIGFLSNLIKKSTPFWLSIISSSFLFIGTIILEGMRGTDEVGLYTAAFNLLLGITYVPLMFSTAVFPVFSRYFLTDKSLLIFAYKKSYQYMLILGLPIFVVIYVYAKDIVLLFYGAKYLGSVTALKILSLVVLLRFVNILAGTVLTSIDRQGSRVLSQMIGTVLNILFSLMLIPKLGLIGLCIALVVSDVCIGTMYHYFLIKYKFNIGMVKASIKPAIAAIFMWLIATNIRSVFVGFIISIILYLSILVIIKTFKKDDKELLMRVVRNN